MDIGFDYYTRAELAAALTVSARTLDRWERERRGPPRTRVGHQIRYRKESVRAWLLKNEGSLFSAGSDASPLTRAGLRARQR